MCISKEQAYTKPGTVPNNRVTTINWTEIHMYPTLDRRRLDGLNIYINGQVPNGFLPVTGKTFFHVAGTCTKYCSFTLTCNQVSVTSMANQLLSIDI